jgi:hypothetical protein
MKCYSLCLSISFVINRSMCMWRFSWPFIVFFCDKLGDARIADGTQVDLGTLILVPNVLPGAWGIWRAGLISRGAEGETDCIWGRNLATVPTSALSLSLRARTVVYAGGMNGRETSTHGKNDKVFRSGELDDLFNQ